MSRAKNRAHNHAMGRYRRARSAYYRHRATRKRAGADPTAGDVMRALREHMWAACRKLRPLGPPSPEWMVPEAIARAMAVHGPPTPLSQPLREMCSDIYVDIFVGQYGEGPPPELFYSIQMMPPKKPFP